MPPPLPSSTAAEPLPSNTAAEPLDSRWNQIKR
jgi:hypothetical protein